MKKTNETAGAEHCDRYYELLIEMEEAEEKGTLDTVCLDEGSDLLDEMLTVLESEKPAHKQEGSQAEFDRYIAGDR